MNNSRESYVDFTNRFTLLIRKNPNLINTTLSNIFTMRLIGNKTHGDLAEIGISEFINQFMYDFKSKHVGKDLFRAKSSEEDILITNELTNIDFPVSLKAYGVGPLQLSTDKHFRMFPRLQKESYPVTEKNIIKEVFLDVAFSEYENVNVLPLIYNEKKKQCNIMVFDLSKAIENTNAIVFEDSGSGRKHPVFRFYDERGGYICEVRYGGASANALQRGLWTHTKNAADYFYSVTDGWIDYSENRILVELFSHALVASSNGHVNALEVLKADILAIKENTNI